MEEKSASLPRESLRQLDLPPELIDHYKSLQRRYSNPIVELRNGVCLGCFMSLASSHKQQVVSSEKGFGICEFCGRILSYEEY